MASVMEVKEDSHSTSVLEKLNEQRLQGLFCDVTVVVEDTKFKAHRNVLAASSTYFKAALSRDASCLPDHIVELPDVPAEVFSSIVNFIYSSRVTLLNSEVAKEIAAVGKQLGIPCLENVGDAAWAQRRTETCVPEQSSNPYRARDAQSSQGTKESSHCSSANGKLDAPQALAPETRLASPSSLVSISPVDLPSQSIRRPMELGSPPSLPFFQSPSIRQDPAENDSLAFRTGPTPSQGQNKLPAGNYTESLALPAAQNKDSGTQVPVVDTEVATAETAKILYTLSTVQASCSSVSNEVDSEQDPGLKNNSEWDPDASVEDSAGETAESECSMDDSGKTETASGFQQSLFPCAVCSRSFSSSTALSLHIKLHRPRKSFACRYCNKSFIHVKRLQTHEMLCKPTDGLPVENEHLANAEETGSEVPHSSEVQSPQPAKHISMKKGHSGLFFRHRSFQRLDLTTDQDHFVKVVDGHIIYFCTICERSYMTLSSLKRHSNVHSWRRRYPCHYCEKVFALAEYRTKHEVWHTGERRYQCIFCWETFVTYYNLKTHQKAFHGINPGLICSEKTPNGGYKPKMNALKLYRLLPMRSEKRPYKTYSQSLSGNLLMPSQALPIPIGDSDPLESNLATALTNADVHSTALGATTSSLDLPETDTYLLQSDLPPPSQDGQQLLKSPQEPLELVCPTGDFQTQKPFQNAIQIPQEGRFSQDVVPKPAPKDCSGDGAVPSVIAYGHPTPSVIVRSASVPSASSTQGPSVITYNSKSASSIQASSPVVRPAKKPVLKDSKPAKLPPVSSDQSTDYTESEEETDSDHRPTHSRGKTMTYTAKPAYVGDASESRGAPLCQITVRIGEEAIVKRRISETDLMRDKSPSSKMKRFDFGAEHSRGEKHSREGGRKGSSSHARETCDEDSDRDAEDQLWRPYYSYKPKRKACNVPKVKKSRWRRKLHYKRSLKWIKRAEREREERETCPTEESPSLAESGTDTPEQESSESIPAETCAKPLPEPTALKHHKNGRASDWRYECTTCGKQFSALKKFQKHEQVHRDTPAFPCGLCMEVFVTRQLAVEHRATHSSETREDPSPKQAVPSGSERVPSFKVSAARVGRKPLVKHNCLCCTKVCKTAAALSRHMKRHDAEKPSEPEPDAKEPSQEGEELQDGNTDETSLATVIAFSKSNDRKSESPPLQEGAVREPPARGSEDLRSSPALLTIKEESPQEMQVSSSSGEHALVEEVEADLGPTCPSQAVSTVHLVSCPKVPMQPRPSLAALEGQSASSSMPLIFSHSSSEGQASQEPVPACSSVEILKVGHQKDQLLTCSPAPPLRIGDLRRPPSNHQQELAMPQGGRTHAVGLLSVEETRLLPTDGGRGSSPRHDLPHLCAEETCVPERKVVPTAHSMPALQRGPEVHLGIPGHKPRLQHVMDLSLQDPMISHTGSKSGPGLPHNAASKLADDFQEPPRHDICLEPSFPIQDYPLPLLTPGGWRTRKEMEEKTLLSYPGPLQFNAMAKMANENVGKVAFYPDPYPLMYGHQLLAYPYSFGNLAALPVALNMVIPDDKGQPLPFLPSMFGYTVNPCRGEVQEGPVLMNGSPNRGKGASASQERPKKGRIL